MTIFSDNFYGFFKRHHFEPDADDVFARYVQPPYQPYQPHRFTVTTTIPRKRVHYHCSRNGGRWK